MCSLGGIEREREMDDSGLADEGSHPSGIGPWPPPGRRLTGWLAPSLSPGSAKGVPVWKGRVIEGGEVPEECQYEGEEKERSVMDRGRENQ